MSETVSRFEARDPSTVHYIVDSRGERRYTGPERRIANRRSGKDRRTEIRFEPSKENRRKNWGRRQDDAPMALR